MQRYKPIRSGDNVVITSAKSLKSPQPQNLVEDVSPRSSDIAPSGSTSGAAAKLGRHIIWRPRRELRPYPGNPRKHPERQIRKLMKVLRRHWTVPILIDESDTILCGHARLEAARRLGIEQVPTIRISGLSEAEKRAIVIADNKLAEEAAWDVKELKLHLGCLLDLDFDVELTGFSTGEVDLIIDGLVPHDQEPVDDLPPFDQGPSVCQPGDEWQLGPHRLLCGDALVADNYARLMGDEQAQMLVSDPPYNDSMKSVVGGGKVKPREFMQASGELSRVAFTDFLAKFVTHAIHHAADGAIHFIFMDWRHLPELLAAALPQYDEWKNLLSYHRLVLSLWKLEELPSRNRTDEWYWSFGGCAELDGGAEIDECR